ncbi:T9SS type B sorting domain-containing protein [Chryseobacterium sp.]|uniref:T9SS type B sorting domain-containing protein n=1 Tax=Chryseobacterium sp. TaxID=1871047 RepID=UPI0025C4477C|nr:T9SS type B sorting domain-containing protein [Chryseobacterium sp.]MBV8324672.1 gliding motility-associated C-terminal domain-containing protein [Chryseobacterium sp.]
MKKYLLIFILCITQMVSAQQDCITALSVCGNSNISYLPDGPGIQELPESNCGSYEERYSVWYKFTVATAGTLTFVISPNTASDYDFYVWGPNITCANKGNTIRCSTPGGTGPTGLNLTSTDPYDYFGAPGSNADGWAKYMDVLPGETYYLLINNYSINITGFSLTWGGTATLASPFNDPALTPNPFVTPGAPNANPADPNEVIICTDPAVFDFNSLSAGIVNGNANFFVTYHTSQNDALAGNNPILTPQTVNTTTTFFYSIHYQDPTDPNNPINSCRQIGKFKFKQGNITADDDTLTMCNNNKAGVATFDLTTANVYNDPTGTAVKKYYPTMNDLNAGTNEITNPYAYVSSTNVVFVKVTTPQGCSDTAQINLELYSEVVVNDADLRTCFIESNPSTGLFNLDNAFVTGVGGATKRYFPSMTDAVDLTNEILNSSNYIAPNGVIYVRVTDSRGCYSVAKVTLTVLPPVKSDILVDKIICMEDKTTLDAGPGFKSYEWSTGATTQSINNAGVGTYWVKLKTGDCVTLQTVKVYASEQPVVSGIDISNNTITVNVIGGTPEYKYSMDNLNWQTANTFTNISRGNHKVYVKDAYDCDPIVISVVVPNLINVITPNADGINDVVDYSALADKQNLILSIYDRYGTKIHQGDQSNGYKWDGMISGKRVPTGTYWYSVTWSENDKKNTPFKFSGWIMVKNRE